MIKLVAVVSVLIVSFASPLYPGNESDSDSHVTVPSGSFSIESPALSARHAAVDRRAVELSRLIGREITAEDLQRTLSEESLRHVGSTEISSILSAYFHAHGEIRTVLPIDRTYDSNRYWFIGSNAYVIPVEISVSQHAPYRIEALWLGSAISYDTALNRTITRLNELPGALSVVVHDRENETELFSINPDRELNATPARPFLIYLAAETLRRDGGPDWEQVVQVPETPRSGLLQWLPAGSPVTRFSLMAAAFRDDRYARNVLIDSISPEYLADFGVGPDPASLSEIRRSASDLIGFALRDPGIIVPDDPGYVFPFAGPVIPGENLLDYRFYGYSAAAARSATAVFLAETPDERGLLVAAVWNDASAATDQRAFFDPLLALTVLLTLEGR